METVFLLSVCLGVVSLTLFTVLILWIFRKPKCPNCPMPTCPACPKPNCPTCPVCKICPACPVRQECNIIVQEECKSKTTDEQQFESSVETLVNTLRSVGCDNTLMSALVRFALKYFDEINVPDVDCLNIHNYYVTGLADIFNKPEFQTQGFISSENLLALNSILYDVIKLCVQELCNNGTFNKNRMKDLWSKVTANICNKSKEQIMNDLKSGVRG